MEWNRAGEGMNEWMSVFSIEIDSHFENSWSADSIIKWRFENHRNLIDKAQSPFPIALYTNKNATECV